MRALQWDYEVRFSRVVVVSALFSRKSDLLVPSSVPSQTSTGHMVGFEGSQALVVHFDASCEVEPGFTTSDGEMLRPISTD